MLYNNIIDLALILILILFVTVVTLFEMLNPIVVSMLVCTILFPEIPERLVKCNTVKIFRRHLDRIDLSKFTTCTY